MDNNVWQESPGAAGIQTVSVVIDRERLRQVETLLQQLDLPPLVPTGVNLPRSKAQDRHNEPSEMQNLTDAFMHLSTSNNPASSTAALLQAHTLPGSSVGHLSPRKGTKYYAIIIGKCTGVYYGEWYVNIQLSDGISPLTCHLLRDDIRCLIDFIMGARYKSFKTLAQATEFYLEHKTKDKVFLVHNPGDEVRFGPEADVIQ